MSIAANSSTAGGRIGTTGEHRPLSEIASILVRVRPERLDAAGHAIEALPARKSTAAIQRQARRRYRGRDVGASARH